MSKLTLDDGSVFAGRYRIVRCIAAGGMGAVYEVIHIETERRRALKVMLPHVVESQELRERFRQEARVAAHIESEYIVDVFDAGIDDATQMPFLVMELLRGEELGKRLKRKGRFEPAEVVLYLEQTARALDKTHRANIVHRDLKPENLFITEREDGRPHVKILDFGIAKLVAEGTTSANATRSMGTPLYMAPEQFKTGSAVYPATDIFALGMIAYTLLAGMAYWKEEAKGQSNVFAFALTAMEGPKEAPSARAKRLGVTLPPAFDAWFLKATSTDHKARFGTAGEAIADLAIALGLDEPSRLRSAPRSDLGQGFTMEMETHVTPGSISRNMPTAGRTPQPSYPQAPAPSPSASPATWPTPAPTGPTGHPQPPMNPTPHAGFPSQPSIQVGPMGHLGQTPLANSGPGYAPAYYVSQPNAMQTAVPAPQGGRTSIAVIGAIATSFLALVTVLFVVLRSPAQTAPAPPTPVQAATPGNAAAPPASTTPQVEPAGPPSAETAQPAPSPTPTTSAATNVPAHAAAMAAPKPTGQATAATPTAKATTTTKPSPGIYSRQ